MAFGARSQSSKTYLERHFESFPSCKLFIFLHDSAKDFEEVLVVVNHLTVSYAFSLGELKESLRVDVFLLSLRIWL